MGRQTFGHRDIAEYSMAPPSRANGHAKRGRKIAARASRCALGLVAVFLLAQAALGAETVQGRVTKVVDGDTVWVTDTLEKPRKVRLVGIDAPERKQPWGEEARRILADRILGEPVAMEIAGYDRLWKRDLAVLYHRGMNVNLWLIQAGAAWAYRGRPNDCPPALRREIEAAEMEARAAARGLWADANGVPPDEHRRLSRSRQRVRGQPSGEQNGQER